MSNPFTVVIASAGSGKTQQIATEAIKSLQNNRPVLALTFTRKAAGELRSRILTLAAREDPSFSLLKSILFEEVPLETGTIDSFTRRIYQHTAPFLLLPTYQNLTVEEADLLQARHHLLRLLWQNLSQKSTYGALRAALTAHDPEKALNLPAAFRTALDNLMKTGPIRDRILKSLLSAPPALSNCTARIILQKALSDLPKFLHDFITPELYGTLEALLSAYRQNHRTLFLVDVQYVVELMAYNVPELVVLPFRHTEHLLLDEAQDTSAQQWSIVGPLLEELSGKGLPVHLVGDPKQSIYHWRGAQPDVFLKHAARAHQAFLRTNHRSRWRLVRFNNSFYARVLSYLNRVSGVLSSGSRSDTTLPRKQKSLSYLHQTYRGYTQRPARRGGLPSRERQSHLRYAVIRVRGYSSEAELGARLRRTLALLHRMGIDPHETAFLVRRWKDVTRLRQTLPECPFQITAHLLGEVPTLHALMQALEEISHRRPPSSPLSPTAYRYFLEHCGLLPVLEEGMAALPSLRNPADWWSFFHTLKVPIDQKIPAESLFWEVFLDHLWEYLHLHITPALPDILSWWQEKGSRIEVEVPLQPGTYPVLTIHRAKGLAWQAVIIPFTDWEFFKYESEKRWYALSKIVSALGLGSSDRTDLEAAVQGLIAPESAGAVRFQAELPLSVLAGDKAMASLYDEDYRAAILENLNLHYVATTRPRRALFVYYRRGEPSLAKGDGASSVPAFGSPSKSPGRKAKSTAPKPGSSFPTTWEEIYQNMLP